ncbi:MAG: GDSL-type esterase/lipase family protein [Kiritimatiellia bacterium]
MNRLKRMKLLALLSGLCLGVGAYWMITRDARPVVVCLGDSLTSCGGKDGKYSDWLARMMPRVKVVNAGSGGDTLDGARKRYPKDVLKVRPDVVVVALGANDFWRNSRDVEAMRDDLVTMIESFQQIGARVVVAGCFGERDYWGEHAVEFGANRFGLAWSFARMEQEVCRAYHCGYLPNMQIDIKPNRLKPFWDLTDHPNPAGNEQIALRMLPYIKAALQ